MAVFSFVTASAGHIGTIVGLFAMSVTNTSNSTERPQDRRKLIAVVLCRHGGL